MTTLHPFRHDNAGLSAMGRSVLAVEQADDLDRIAEDDTALVIWHRTMPQTMQQWINDLNPAVLPRVRVVLTPDRVAAALDVACGEAGMPACTERRDLVADIADLADRMATIGRAAYVRIRLEPVSSDSCRRFHVDAMLARLVCTYRGPGTQFGLTKSGEEPAHVHSTPTGAAILLRGLDWPGKTRNGLVHRSPPIAGTGITRLVLAIDPVFDLDEDA